ncbi:DnaB-like helicase C-terminal domain-containing protein [Bacteroides clarus]|uniref:DnaB-like helicase C-terminal domain-containing protein n=1 Tax=Bacteroides clarus TaxID=626929 RepID=UPI00210178DE|nr:DnaB-like helicase C-terminal domain-containing protein [Bacteroides clarus]MCQ1545163.1 DnaB-like helicase C-terminal domain-containing protein [Bacteroides clarus]
MKSLGIHKSNRTQKPNVKSGFPELDKITNGWNNGNLIVIAARPAMGKTAFGMSLLKEIAVKNRIPTAFFSLEMSSKQAIDRFRMALSKVDIAKIREYDNGNIDALSEEEKYRIEDAEKQMDIAPIYLDDTPSLSIFELYQKATRLISDFQIKLIIVDYLQLMHPGLLLSERNEEIAYIIRRLKALAKDLNIPIIAFSQLNRKESGEKVEGRRPQLRDLRYDTIEQDADVICFIHRPEYYKIYTDFNGNDLHGKAEIIVAKNRNGNTGDVLLKFNGECSSFDNLDE